MALSTRKFQKQEIVFAKVGRYPPWPAFIKKIEGKQIEVMFNSANAEVNWVHEKNVTPLLSTEHILKRYLGTNQKFKEDVSEIAGFLSEFDIGKKFLIILNRAQGFVDAKEREKEERKMQVEAIKAKPKPKVKKEKRSAPQSEYHLRSKSSRYSLRQQS